MEIDADRFLLRHFRESARRGAPLVASMETRSDRGITLEQRHEADAAYVWSLCVLARLQRSGALSAQVLAVLRAYYLRLTPEHASIVERRWGRGDGASRVTVSILGTGGEPDVAADLQSQCDWTALARACDVRGRRAAQEMWTQGRAVVREELERRGALE